MFLELSDGAIINTEQISFMRKLGAWQTATSDSHVIAFTGGGSCQCGKEDANKIMAILLGDGRRKVHSRCNATGTVFYEDGDALYNAPRG